LISALNKGITNLIPKKKMTPQIPPLKRCHAVCVCLIVFISCSSSLDKKEYIRWVESYDHGLHIRKTNGDFSFDLQYQPAQYVALQRMLSSADTFNDSLQHFVLTITPIDNQDFIDHDVHDIAEKQRRLYYFSYLFQNDIHLEENGHRVPCALYHFERQSDLKKSRTFVLAFESIKESSDEVTIVINSDQIGSLPVKIKVSHGDIPSLRI